MVLDENLITYVFAPSKTTHGVTDIHLLTNPPTLHESYHLLHSLHPDHYAIFLASPTDPPGEIIYGEVQIPGGIDVTKGEKAIILHQPEEVIAVGDKKCRLGFKFDWTFEWEGKKFKWSRNCIAGIMKSMTLVYKPSRQFRDDPPITLALYNPTPQVTLLDYNFPRIPINDVKGFEIIVLLFVSLFNDIVKHEGKGLVSMDIKKETIRLQKKEHEEEERLRKVQAEELHRETERLRKIAHDEYIAKKKRDEEIEQETERLRIQEGWYSHNGQQPPSPPSSSHSNKKKHWWNFHSTEETQGNGEQNGQWSSAGVNEFGYQGYGPKYSMTGARVMGYNTY